MDPFSRRCFLAGALGAGALAMLGGGCGGAVAPDGTVVVTGGQAFLSFDKFPKLQQVGGGVTVGTEAGTPFAVVRTALDAAVAVNAVCTHEGCTAVYDATGMDLRCACHGSQFALSGAVMKGPAVRPLTPLYTATVGAAGITVALSA
jgi:Rieske Fe-S protein